MRKPFPLALLLSAALWAAPLWAQEPQSAVLDSVIVEGNQRLTAAQVISSSGLVLHQPANYRDIQRALQALFRTGQFDDVTANQREVNGQLVLVLVVKERPILQRWTLKGVEKVSEGSVKARITLTPGRPLDRAAVARSRASIDSLYKAQGYYAARVKVVEIAESDERVRIVFEVDEGSRVAISEIIIDSNSRFTDQQIVKQMQTRPEGFFWFQKGRYDDDRVERDMRERLPGWYANHGFIDFQVLDDSVHVDTTRGKAILALTVDEGQQYMVGTLDIQGNRRFSSAELQLYYPFPLLRAGTIPFDKGDWDTATERVRNLYSNNGYIYSRVEAVESRRTLPDGTPVLDLSWMIHEGSPATINRIDIVGNDITHERVIRDVIVLLPGSLFSRDLLIRSYQNISNLGFFQQPMPPPDVRPTENQVDVDIIFRVVEKRTGNINFGASLGQGTGIGGFVGLEEPNLFGKGKKAKLQWQFGRNIMDFTLAYTDPAIRESRYSGTLTLYNSRLKYTVGDLGNQRTVGGSIQVGFPFLGSRYTRLITSYGLQVNSFTGGSIDRQTQFNCTDCTRSTLGAGIIRDTRIDLPFATAGTFVNIRGELNGGALGGTGDYQKVDLEGRWYAPLGSLGGSDAFGKGVRFVLGITARSGFIWGDVGPFYTELYAMGGIQYGIPLRGYEEFSITPQGFDPLAGGNNAASAASFGASYAAFTTEFGARLSQAFYVNLFMDLGNVYRTPEQFDPTVLFRGAGLGLAVISPLGPLGIDLAYGFDKVDLRGQPNPGWKVHFRLGNFF